MPLLRRRGIRRLLCRRKSAKDVKMERDVAGQQDVLRTGDEEVIFSHHCMLILYIYRVEIHNE